MTEEHKELLKQLILKKKAENKEKTAGTSTNLNDVDWFEIVENYTKEIHQNL